MAQVEQANAARREAVLALSMQERLELLHELCLQAEVLTQLDLRR